MFIAALFIIANLWKQPTVPTIDKWIKKVVVHIQNMKYYSAIKNNKILPFVTTWIESEDIMLHEIYQRKKNTI